MLKKIFKRDTPTTPEKFSVKYLFRKATSDREAVLAEIKYLNDKFVPFVDKMNDSLKIFREEAYKELGIDELKIADADSTSTHFKVSFLKNDEATGSANKKSANKKEVGYLLVPLKTAQKRDGVIDTGLTTWNSNLHSSKEITVYHGVHDLRERKLETAMEKASSIIVTVASQSVSDKKLSKVFDSLDERDNPLKENRGITQRLPAFMSRIIGA